MEIRQLEALNAIVTSGSVTAAGRMLGRSQPVVSRQISDLEAELGFLLFTRTRPTITLTEQGAEFYQEVRGILAELHQLESRVQGMRNGQVRPLRVLAAVDLARGLLPEALARMDRFSPVFREKLIKRKVSLKHFSDSDPGPGPKGSRKMAVSVKEGIDKDAARILVKHIKDSKLKVQAAIQQDTLRVTGKKRDDLQEVIADLKAQDFELDLQFVNFRD